MDCTLMAAAPIEIEGNPTMSSLARRRAIECNQHVNRYLRDDRSRDATEKKLTDHPASGRADHHEVGTTCRNELVQRMLGGSR
jgi:hypothetical protein